MLLTALASVPSGARLFELPNKVGTHRDACFAARGLYRGRALFGVALLGALAANLGPAAARLAFAGGLLIVLSLGVLFAWTFPADLATEIRTRMPADRRARRRRWEHPRAANVRLVFLALCPAVLSVVLDDAREGDGDRA